MNQKSKDVEFGNNQLIGFYCDYAIVYDFEKEELYYFESPVIESMIGNCVEVQLLNPLDELPERMQNVIYQEFCREDL